jgi:multiple sugar transport system substrate-binding protein
MATITRRGLGAAGLGVPLGLIGAPRQGAAQPGAPGFMSFTYAEDAGRPHVQAVLDSFRAAGGTAVEPIGSAWGDMQRNILLRSRSRNLPASAQVQERWLPSLAGLPEILDLETLFGPGTLDRAMDPAVLAMGRHRGRLIGLPLVTGSIGMIANTEVLARAGVGRMPATLEEFRAALVAVRDRVPNSVPFAMATRNPNSIPLDALIWVWTHGGRIVDEEGVVRINTPKGRAAIEHAVGMMRDRLVAPEIDRPDARRLFAQGAAAFYIDAPQGRLFIRTFSGRGEAADAFTRPVPTPVLRAGEAPRSVQWGHLVVFFRGPHNAGAESAGARWARHLAGDAVQATFPVALSALPATRAGRAAPAVQDDAYFKAWAEAAGSPLPHEIGIWSNAPELSTILSEELQAAMLGQKPPAAAAASMQSRMEASMARRAG